MDVKTNMEKIVVVKNKKSTINKIFFKKTNLERTQESHVSCWEIYSFCIFSDKIKLDQQINQSAEATHNSRKLSLCTTWGWEP